MNNNKTNSDMVSVHDNQQLQLLVTVITSKADRLMFEKHCWRNVRNTLKLWSTFWLHITGGKKVTTAITLFRLIFL